MDIEQKRIINERWYEFVITNAKDLDVSVNQLINHLKTVTTQDAFQDLTIEFKGDEIRAMFDSLTMPAIHKRTGLSYTKLRTLKPPRKRWTLVSPEGKEHTFTVLEFARHIGRPRSSVSGFFSGASNTCHGWTHKGYVPKPDDSFRGAVRELLDQGVNETTQIAERVGCSEKTVNRYKREFGINKKSQGYILRDADCVEYRFDNMCEFIRQHPEAKLEKSGLHQLIHGKILYYKGFYNPEKVPLTNHENRERIYQLIEQKKSIQSIAKTVDVPVEIVRYYASACKKAHFYHHDGGHINQFKPIPKKEPITSVSCSPSRRFQNA